MIRLSHIINPVLVDENSDLFEAQPVTFETMRIAKEFSAERVSIELFSAQYEEDRAIIPDYFKKTTNLDRSILDIGNFKIPRKLPFLKDVLDRLYEASDADYFIYTNSDIALMPHFYITVSDIINQGYDGFVINRRTIPPKYDDIKDIFLMFAEAGEPHKGYDCFVFRRDVYPEYRLGDVCLGIAGVGRILLWNVVAHANRFREFKDYHLTFHIGNDSIWRKEEYNDYTVHNKNEAINVARDIRSNTNAIISINSNTLFRGYKQYNEIKSILHEATENYISQHKFIFIAGLHRSGTTILADCLKEHPDVSSFANTGFPKDEGQFLQSVFPPAKEFGGPGKFGFNKEMHLTEECSLVNGENREKLLAEWCLHWDISKPVLLEKSPPNLLKLRFLQAMFPDAYFIIITRHPIAVSYATQKWSKSPLDELLLHWIESHKILLEDLLCIRNYLIIGYEDFVSDPNRHINKICEFVGIDNFIFSGNIEKDTNSKYRTEWTMEGQKKGLLEKYGKYDKLFQKFNYDLEIL